MRVVAKWSATFGGVLGACRGAAAANQQCIPIAAPARRALADGAVDYNTSAISGRPGAAVFNLSLNSLGAHAQHDGDARLDVTGGRDAQTAQ